MYLGCYRLQGFAACCCRSTQASLSSAIINTPDTDLACAGRPISKLEPVVREVLRVGIYEIGELGLADHAIGAHVDITKALAQPHLGSFVNGEVHHQRAGCWRFRARYAWASCFIKLQLTDGWQLRRRTEDCSQATCSGHSVPAARGH